MKHIWQSVIFLFLLLSLSCENEAENSARAKVIGFYEGDLVFWGTPMPGLNGSQIINFQVIPVSWSNKIRIVTSFDIVLDVTRSFINEANGDEIITLNANAEVSQNSNGMIIQCGNTDFQGWGEMCGYYNATDKRLTVHFGWSDTTQGSPGFIFAEKRN